jgi:two-component system phosphate regulon sensor histidine kinase PhoR
MVSYVGSQSDITHKKELERLKDQFVADVSHELRTPTSNISLYLELLEDATSQRRSEFLEIIKEQNNLLKKLVEDILDLSRLGRRKIRKIEFAPVDLNSVAEQVLVAHLPQAEAGNISLYFEPDNGLPPARGEENQLGRVVTNLVSNAIRYTLRGYVSVRTYKENGCACLEVCDTGLGIDPEDLPHLFERFYRGKQVRQSKIHGTGLGLAIVKEIVEAHEGSIDVESRSGTGSIFRVRLPVYQLLNDE